MYIPSWVGYLTAVSASVMFGSCYVPMKRFDTGDGLFFQWIFGGTVFLFGVVCESFAENLVFDWYGVLGGAVWALGNVCVVPILRFLGLGLGFLVWSGTNLLGAYAWGAFGLFGLEREHPKNITVSLAGLALGVLSLLIFLLIKPDLSNGKGSKDGADDGAGSAADDYGAGGRSPSLGGGSGADLSDLESVRDDLILRVKESRGGGALGDGAGGSGDAADADAPLVFVYGEWLLTSVPGGGRLFGLVLALWSGLCYSWNAVPYTVWHQDYVRDHDNKEPGPFDYFFCFGTGVFLCASVMFFLYCAVTLNRPRLYPAAILPSVVAGIMWSFGNASLMVTAGSLGLTVGYPMVALGPLAVTTFWSVLVFREIRGLLNYALLVVSLSLVGLAITCLVVSKLVDVPYLPASF